MASPLLEIRNLIIRRGDARILNGIDWKIAPGEHWAILGPNGCGKTSLLSAITAYLTPSEGEIHLLGEEYGNADWTTLRQDIGMVSTSLAWRVPPDETALETVLSGESAQIGYWTRSKEDHTGKALRCLGKLRVRRLADRPWAVLSQGERQKVFIARALMADPKLLILDEPCAGLDPVAREAFLSSLQTLARSRRGPSLILVTHHVEEIFPEISHVLLLRKGKVLASGPREEVLTSAHVSKAFGADIEVLSGPAGRYDLKLRRRG